MRAVDMEEEEASRMALRRQWKKQAHEVAMGNAV